MSAAYRSRPVPPSMTLHTTALYASSLQTLQKNLPFLLLVVLLAVLTLMLREFIPIDETRYVAVAWEMWNGHHWFIPTINGNVYMDKPPLLFWLVHLGWYLFGVNDWWPRIIPFIFVLLNIVLTRSIACRLWPEQPYLYQLVPLMLMSVPVWFIYATPFMFDMVQTFLVLAAVYGLMTYRYGSMRVFIIAGVACGLGMLLKGPVILVYVLPLLLGLPLWHECYTRNQWRSLGLGIGIVLLVSLLVFATWLIPVIQTLGLEQAHAVFLHQTADRMFRATSHARPFWWYFPYLLLMAFPWAWKISFWRSLGIRKTRAEQKKWIFLLLWIIPPFLFLASISAKQLHYLLPLLPPVVIAMAGALLEHKTAPGPRDNYLAGCLLIFVGVAFFLYRTFTVHEYNQWIDQVSVLLPVTALVAGLLILLVRTRNRVHSIETLALGTLVFLYSGYAMVLSVPRPFTGIEDFSRVLASLQRNNIPLGYVGSHREQFLFPGRMTRPLDKVAPGATRDWAEDHPEGYIITLFRDTGAKPGLRPRYLQPYRFRQNLVLISCRDILQKHDTFRDHAVDSFR